MNLPSFKHFDRSVVSIHARERMVREQLESRGICDERVLDVMRTLPRHIFVEEALSGHAYGDSPLPIGEGQTLSQPYIVAKMTESLELTGTEEVLEIGTGSGYQTAVLSVLCQKVFTIERLPNLAEIARKRLRWMQLHNVVYRVGDGTLGWPEPRQFDRILVTAGAPVTPAQLIAQLSDGGLLVVPEGNKDIQQLLRIHKRGNNCKREVLEACRFVPLVGAQGWDESS